MFTELHMKYVFFLYGLSFFVLGFAIVMYPKKNSVFALAPHLNLIAGFGLIHGLNEWLDLFIQIHPAGTTHALELTRAITLPTSFLFLLLFGTQSNDKSRQPNLWLRSCPIVLMSLWLASVLFSDNKAQMNDIASRYLLGFPGAVLTSYALSRHLTTLRQTGLRGVIKHLKLMIVVFFAYGILAGLIVKKAPFFPANIFNYDLILNICGTPIQIFRAICASLLAYSTLRVLSVFHWETQQQLRESESRLRTIASASPAILIKSDIRGRFTSIEGQGAEGLPGPVSELIGRPISDLFPDFDIERVHTQAWHPGMVHNSKVTAASKTYELGYSPVQDEEGDISGYVGAAIDITQRLEAKSEIDAYRQELSKTRRLTELGMMSKVLAEKLKKPLNVAHMLLQRLAVESDTPQASQNTTHAIEQSLEQVTEAFSVVKRFCDHVDMPATVPQNTSLDLQDFFARLIAVFEDRAKQANLTITLDFCPPKICLIIAPKELQYIVSTVMEHILERANTETDQALKIQCHPKADHLLIQFTDTCYTLSKEEIDNAFVPFALNTPDAEHHELGLAVVQQIAQENQGSITINSQEGQGTTFSLTLPTCPSQKG